MREMIRCTPRRWFLPYVSGALFAAAWWVYIDALLYHAARGCAPAPDAAWYMPGLLATFAGFMAALTPLDALDTNSWQSFASSATPGGRASCARCWLFCSFLLSFAALILAILISVGISRADTVGPPASPPTFPGLVPLHTAGAPAVAGWDLARPQFSAWPGHAMLVQAAGILAATVLWMYGRFLDRTDAFALDEK